MKIALILNLQQKQAIQLVATLEGDRKRPRYRKRLGIMREREVQDIMAAPPQIEKPKTKEKREIPGNPQSDEMEKPATTTRESWR
jgi:hypothetical protein